MKGDFSRIPFDPKKHYSGVLHQQGRVWLDSDWNEEVGERIALLRQELRDLVGPCGVPSSSTFQISASPDARPDNFQISGGHGYVDGILSEIEGNIGYLNQPDFPDPPSLNIPADGSTLTALIYLEVWHRLITYLEDDSIREVALGGPDTSARIKTVTQVKVVTIPNGTTKCADASQFLPQAGGGQLTTLQPAVNPALTACQLPDPANFTGRENHLYRVEIHDGGDVAGAPGGFSFTAPLSADAAVGATSLTVAPPLTAAQIDAATRSGFLTIAAGNGVSERVPLASVNTAGTTITLGQPLANAYTVANRAALSSGSARFKWSRDNASFAVGVTTVKSDRITITLASGGRDLATAFRQGDIVELTDDASELGPARGHLTTLNNDPDPDLLTVLLADPLPAKFKLNGEVSARHLVMRRWDGVADTAAAFDDAATPGMNLGDGVHVQFSGQNLLPGDYWQFAARTADGSIQALTNASPHGIKRNRCSLAVVTWGPPPPTSPPSSPPAGVALTKIQDCRRVFPSLVDFPQAEKGFRINGVFAVDSANAQTILLNDTDVHVNAFNGIDILCDTPPDPASVSRPTFTLIAEVPNTQNGPAAVSYFPVNLAAAISVDTGRMVISWRGLAQTQSLLTDMINASPNERGVLMRFTLKGKFIWALNNPNLFLDGEAFGQRLTGTNNTSLQLPSGANRRGSDFQMWFWIVAAPSFSKDIAVDPAQIYIGEVATFTVTLSSSAPAGAPAATLASSSPAVAAVPATAAVPAGATSFTFTATGLTAGVTSVSASFGGPPAPPATTLTVLALPSLTGQITIAPVSILLGGVATAIVTLNSPAPLAGATVTLTSSSGAAALPVPSVIVPTGSTSISFPIIGAGPGSATITATLSWPNGATSNVSGIINIRVKSKDKDKELVKEGLKDIRDNPKFSDKIEKIREVKLADKIRDVSPGPGVIGNVDLPGGVARSFITPEERPEVEQHTLDASGPENVN